MTLFMEGPLKCSHIFVLGSGTSRKRKRRKKALQHLAANDCCQSIGELNDEDVYGWPLKMLSFLCSHQTIIKSHN